MKPGVLGILFFLLIASAVQADEAAAQRMNADAPSLLVGHLGADVARLLTLRAGLYQLVASDFTSFREVSDLLAQERVLVLGHARHDRSGRTQDLRG